MALVPRSERAGGAVPVTDQRVNVPLTGTAVPVELLEAVARGVVAAFAPPQPAPSAAGEAVDFLTAGQFAVRLGVSRETVRRLAIADVLPCTVVCRGSQEDDPPVPAAVRGRFRRQRPGRERPGRVRGPMASPDGCGRARPGALRPWTGWSA